MVRPQRVSSATLTWRALAALGLAAMLVTSCFEADDDDAAAPDTLGGDVTPCPGGAPLNLCGGCAPLQESEGQACGSCDSGRWRCVGGDLACEGDLAGRATDATCPEGARCLEGRCVAARCTRDEDCLAATGAQICEAGACVDPACWNDRDCSEETPLCEGGRCVSGGCEGARNACGGCAALAEAPGDACGACGGGTLRCATSGDALFCEGAPDLTSDPASCGGCGNACAPGAACVGGVCEAPGRCEVDQDCPGGQVCSAGVCGAASCPESITFCGTCADAALAGTHIGCSFVTADLPHFDDTFSAGDRRSALVLTNPGARSAQVDVFAADSALTIPPELRARSVAPGQSVTLLLPAAQLVTSGVTRRTFRVTSSEPIIVHQLKHHRQDADSSDGTLLLPLHALGTRYRVVSWPGSPPMLPQFSERQGDGQYGWFAVVGTAAAPTELTITFSAASRAGPSVPAYPAGEPQGFTLQEGEVAVFFFDATEGPAPVARDATGTLIAADQPVAVFSGHAQAVVAPPGELENCCADRIETQLYPERALGRRYVAAASAGRGVQAQDVYRVVATRPGTVVTTQPPISGLEGVVLDAGAWAEVSARTSFYLEATEPVLLAQYLVGKNVTSLDEAVGDPALLLVPPLDALLDRYLVTVPSVFPQTWVALAYPTGTTLRLDGAVLQPTFEGPVGTSGWTVASLALPSGVHHLAADQPFSVHVYGYAPSASFALVAGLRVQAP